MPISERLTARLHTHAHRPSNGRGQFRPRLRPEARAILMAVGSMALLASLAALPLPAWSQGAAAPSARHAYNIPAGALAPALRNLASTANVLLTFTESQTAGKTTAGISGPYTPQAALAVLLAGTGLQAAPLDNGGYVLRSAPATAVTPAARPVVKAEPAALPLVSVKAEADRSGITEGTRSYTANATSVAVARRLV